MQLRANQLKKAVTVNARFLVELLNKLPVVEQETVTGGPIS